MLIYKDSLHMDAFGGGLGTILSLGNSGLFKYVESGYTTTETTYTFKRAQTIVFCMLYSDTSNYAGSGFVCPGGSLPITGALFSDGSSSGGCVGAYPPILLDADGITFRVNGNKGSGSRRLFYVNFIGFSA